MVRWLLLDQPMFSENNIDYVLISQDIEKITTPEARIAVVAAGITPYFSESPRHRSAWKKRQTHCP